MFKKKKTKYKLPRPYTELGSTLCSARLAANLTQKTVSDKLGYSSAQFISNFERGIAAPPAAKLKTLAKMYGLSTGPIADLYANAEKTRILEALK